ncbi:MAG: patatin-like phospholipase family protein, partial [Candidatus Neomarinimicrobiota bacterium]
MDLKNRFWGFLILMTLTFGSSPDRPRIGLALSGGSSMGLAHIGALKLLDSLQIPVDYIAGTSMGGLLGALYAIGYSGAEIEQIALELSWDEVFSDQPPRDRLPYFQKKDLGRYQFEFGFDGFTPSTLSGLVHGQNIMLSLSELTYAYEHITDFDDLPIPFRCTAVDLITGNIVILRNGSLAKAMRATMSIPSVFSPVEWGDSLLVDGGILNNYPTDVVRAMGADYIIAVSVGWSPKPREELQDGIDMLIQSGNIVRRAQLNSATDDVDVHIFTELPSFMGAEFKKAKIIEIIRDGENSARQALPKLLELKENYRLARTFPDLDAVDSDGNRLKFYSVSIVGNTTIPFSMIYRELGISPNDNYQADSLETKVRNMYRTGWFESIDYEVRPLDEQYVKLFLQVREKQPPLIYGIQIIGNKSLPFTFIYRLLGLKPGDVFDTAIINDRITDLYGLGYFNTISYEIDPVDENSIRLIINIEESSLRKLRFGLRYDLQ